MGWFDGIVVTNLNNGPPSLTNVEYYLSNSLHLGADQYSEVK
jgi:hypothetical protein